MSQKKEPYHTALKRGTIEEAMPCHLFEGASVTAFSWDLMDGWNDRHLQAECMYMELPWMAGFRVFEERAGFADREGRTHRGLMEQVSTMILELDCPVVVVGPSQALECWKGYDQHFDSEISGHGKGHECTITTWNDPGLPRGSSDEVLASLAARFGSICDPACGYGRTGRYVKPYGCEAILSDYNANCIGFIRDNWSAW